MEPNVLLALRLQEAIYKAIPKNKDTQNYREHSEFWSLKLLHHAFLETLFN